MNRLVKAGWVRSKMSGQMEHRRDHPHVSITWPPPAGPQRWDRFGPTSLTPLINQGRVAFFDSRKNKMDVPPEEILERSGSGIAIPLVGCSH